MLPIITGAVQTIVYGATPLAGVTSIDPLHGEVQSVGSVITWVAVGLFVPLTGTLTVVDPVLPAISITSTV